MQINLFKKSAILIECGFLQKKLYETILEINNFEVYTAKSAMDGLIKIKESKYDLIVINIEIGEESFIKKLISQIRAEQHAIAAPIIGLSIYKETSRKNIANELDAFLTKPIPIDEFTSSIFACIENFNNKFVQNRAFA